MLRRRLPQSSILFFGLALACGLAAAMAIRAYAHRLEITRPDGGHPVSVLAATRDLPRGTVLASTDVRALEFPSAGFAVVLLEPNGVERHVAEPSSDRVDVDARLQ